MKVAMLFTGYGSQFVGMGKELYDKYRVVQEYFEEASHCLNRNFVKLCFASSDVELSKPENAYPAIFLINSALYKVLQQEQIVPTAVAGYNDGEYAALFAAGCFSFPDGLYLLTKFDAFYQDFLSKLNSDVAILRVIGIETKNIEIICSQISTPEKPVFIAIYNGITDHVLAGDRKSIEQVWDEIGKKQSVTKEYLEVGVGLHSSLMNIVTNQFIIYLEKVDFKDIIIPLISSLDGKEVFTGQEIKKRIIQHVNSPLVFNKVVKALAYYDVIIQVHPGNQVRSIIEKQYPEKIIFSIKNPEDIAAIKKIIVT